MKTSQLVLSTLSVISSTRAFKVHFYSDANCAGALEGATTISLAHDTCSTMGAGVAEGALIEKEAGDGENDVVAFWSDKDCNGNIVAESMSGCVTISSFFDNYAALSVISGKPKTETKRAINDTFDREDFVKRAYNGEYEPIGSDHPDWEKYTVNNTSIWHGKEEDYYGRTIRWHEEWMGIYAGIDIADWNDTIHVRNPTKLIFNATFPIDFTNNHLITSRNDSNSGTDLEDRYLEGICNAFRNCADQVTMLPAGTTMNTLITYAVNAYVAANNGGTRVWNYVRENPRAIAFHAYTQGAAVVTGVISAALYDTWKGSGTESQHQDLEKCSTAGTEAGTLAAMVTHTTTTTETITSIQTILQTMTATQYTAAFQITPGTCMTCYAGECAAPDTKKMKAKRVVNVSGCKAEWHA